MIATVIFIIVVFCLAACHMAGRIITEERHGDVMRRVTVIQPSGAVEPATLEHLQPSDPGVKGPHGADGSLRASTGARQQVDQVGLRRTGIVTWSGVGLCVLGATLIVARAWLPVIPMSASIAAIGVGVGLLWLPAVIEQYTWLLVASGGLIAILYLTGGIDNWLKLHGPKANVTTSNGMGS